MDKKPSEHGVELQPLKTKDEYDLQDDGDHTRVPREMWARKTEYLLSLIGYSVGLGVVWRFPYLCLRNGGGAFLIPFFTFMLICGFPLYFMELSLGQFSGKSPLVLWWSISPLFKGVGYCMATISFICSWYYGLVIAWILCYLFYSFFPIHPWASCNNSWNTENCVVLRSEFSQFSLVNHSTSHLFNASDYYNVSIVRNVSREGGTNLDALPTAANEFWRYKVLGISSGLDDVGTPQWHLMLTLFLSTLATFLCLVRGVRSVGKVVYVTALLPYILLTIILVRSLTLQGSVDGVIYYMKPDFSKLLTFKVWFEAALQVFYSLGPAWGGVLTMASYNRFHNKCLRDAALCTATDCFSNFFCGFVVFSILGFLAHESGLTVADVAESGPGLVFQVYPEALTRLPVPHLWAILFFIMLFAVGLDSQFGMLETVLGGLRDMYPQAFSKRKNLVLLCTFAIYMIMSIIFATPAGVYIFTLIDWYATSYCIFLTSFLECFIVGWIYGAERFSRDIEIMTGRRVHTSIRISWCIITPLAMVVALLTTISSYDAPAYGDYVFPEYSEHIGVIIALFSVLPIPFFVMKELLTAEGPLRERVKTLLQPLPNWVPNHREEHLKYERYHHVGNKWSYVKTTVLGSSR